jgi:hypothetical protein
MCAALLLCCLAADDPAAAAEQASGQPDEAAALARTIQNPIANLLTVPFQFNFDNGSGDDDRRIFNLNIQPVIPFPGEKWNVISRTIIPVNSVPQGETDSVFGLGDVNFSLFWSPAGSKKLTWGVGPAAVLPTASNPEVLGTGKWSVGPTAVIFYGIGKWTMGATANNVWSVAGDSDREDVNRLFAQWFVNYNLGQGWAVGSVPIITCNWEIDSGDQCTIPWGAQVSKVMRFGSRPVNLLFGYYENSRKPDGGADNQVRFQINFLFPQTGK